MTLNPTDWAALATLTLAVLVMANRDDPRWSRWLRRKWSNTVGAWFARRRMRIRVPAPDEHSPGIMSARRDINTGCWS